MLDDRQKEIHGHATTTSGKKTVIKPLSKMSEKRKISSILILGKELAGAAKWRPLIVVVGILILGIPVPSVTLISPASLRFRNMRLPTRLNIPGFPKA